MSRRSPWLWLPIVVFFVPVPAAVTRLWRHRRAVKIARGPGLYTYVGLVLFLTGVNVGFMPAGSYLGETIAALAATAGC